MHYEQRPRGHGPVTHAMYRQEPYVRATLADGTMIDGKAKGWTETAVDVHWHTSGGKVYNQWVDAAHVQRIKRSESSWQDPYDIVDHE